MAAATDPLTLAVIEAGLQQVCNEMELAFSRSAFSPVIAEADDRSDGIHDRDTGALIAQGELGLPVFVGVMQASTGEIIRLIREGRVAAPDQRLSGKWLVVQPSRVQSLGAWPSAAAPTQDRRQVEQP